MITRRSIDQDCPCIMMMPLVDPLRFLLRKIILSNGIFLCAKPEFLEFPNYVRYSKCAKVAVLKCEMELYIGKKEMTYYFMYR